jgi:hypothetical protein
MKTIALLFLTAALALAADISGKWRFNVETDMGSGSPTFTFKQDGDSLTGTYSGAFGEANVTGKVNGDKVEFWFDASPGGEKITIKYAGVVEENKMKGTVDLGGQAKGTFTAEKE